jgi:hypothetical protein
MAIFIASTKSISRGNGQSAVASASYRAGLALDDIRYGKTHDYSKRSGVLSADIILPSSLADAKSIIDRAELWNKAEAAEKRKDARVAREWLVNLPYELSAEERKSLAHSFAQKLADRYGTIADCAIHQPTQKEIERGADPRNYHAHIMFTTRCAELNENNEITLTDKATIELSDKKRRSLGLERVSEEIKEVRQLWEQTANDKLAERNLSLIDSRSYADQGKDIEPQIKMGSVATKLERDKYESELEKAEQAVEKGEVYEIDETPATIRGEINAMIAERNALVLQASNRIIVEKRDLDERLERAERHIDRADQRIGLSERWINSNSKRASRSEQDIEWARKRCENLPKRTDDTTQRIDGTAQANGKLTQRIDDTKQAIKGITEAIAKSDIEINAAAERSARPAPSPFDDTYRRAFLERERRINKELREYDRQAHRESYADEKDNNDLRATLSVFAHRLMTRHNEKFSLRPGFRDNPADYPEKFDYRQVKILDSFANELGLNNDFDDFREEQRRVADLFTFGVMQDNLNAMDILINRQKERKNYNEVTADFDEFITRLDANRAAKNKELQGSLGRSDISRMTAETLTAVSYLEHIEQYISKETTADECKALAQDQISETLRRTSRQYQLAFEGLRTLDTNEIAQKHARTLESNLSRFTAKYADKLTDSDIKAVNDGLKVIDQEVEVTKPINRPTPF